MSDWDEYAELYMLVKGEHNYNVAQCAYLAGQSSAEQRVKELAAQIENCPECEALNRGYSASHTQNIELKAKCRELENDNRALHEQFIYLTKEEIPKLQAKCAELERERDSLETDLAKYITDYNALKAQAGVPDRD